MNEISQAIKNIKQSKQWKYLNDKTNAFMVSLDDTKTAIIKACNHDVRPPKEKHVRKLLSILSADNGETQQIVTLLAQKMQNTSSWIVALKAAQVFHRLIQESGDRFTNMIIKLGHQKVFRMQNWKDKTPTSQSFTQTTFIRSYVPYLESRVVLFKVAQLRQLSPKYTFPPKLPEMLVVIEQLQNTMDYFLSIEINEDVIDNGSSLNAVSLLLKDSMLLYKLLSDGIIYLIDQFSKLDLDKAKLVVVHYEKHLQQNGRLIRCYDVARNLNGIIASRIPTLSMASDSLLKQMKKYVEDPNHGSFSATGQDEHIEQQASTKKQTSNLISLLDETENKPKGKGDDSNMIFTDFFKPVEFKPQKGTEGHIAGHYDADDDGFGEDPFATGADFSSNSSNDAAVGTGNHTATRASSSSGGNLNNYNNNNNNLPQQQQYASGQHFSTSSQQQQQQQQVNVRGGRNTGFANDPFGDPSAFGTKPGANYHDQLGSQPQLQQPPPIVKQQKIITGNPTTNNKPLSLAVDDPFSFLSDVTRKDTDQIKQEIINAQRAEEERLRNQQQQQQQPTSTNPFDSANPFDSTDPFFVNNSNNNRAKSLIDDFLK